MPAGEAGGEEESTLLAVPPGSRNAPRLTPGSKGKVYFPKRDDRRSGRGPRARSVASAAGQQHRSTKRTVYPGSEINTLYKPIGANVGIYEEDTSIYNLREQNEEDKLFNVNNSVKILLESLELKNSTDLAENKDEN